MKVLVEYSDILRRQFVLGENYQINNSDNCKLFLDKARREKDRYSALRFLKECASSVNSIVPYFPECVEIFEQQYIDNASNIKEMESVFCNEIVTRFPNINKKYKKKDIIAMENCVMQSTLPDSVKDAVKTQITKNKVCDRILENHNILSEEFDLSVFVSQNYRNKELIVEKVCDVINNFNDIKPYAKVNSAIEETTYLFQKEGIAYNERDLVDKIVEYFMLDNITDEDATSIYKVVTENHCIDVVGTSTKNKPYNKILSEFMNLSYKSPEDLHNTIDSVLTLETVDIMNGFPPLLNLFETMMVKNHNLVPVLLDTTIQEMFTTIQEKTEDQYYRDLLTSINETTTNKLRSITNLSNYSVFGGDIVINMTNYRNELSGLRESLVDELSIIYPYENIQIMKEAATTTISLNEFKIFKFNNLLNTCMKIDRLLKEKIKGLKDRTQGKIKGVKDKLKDVLGLEQSVYDMISEDNTIDYCAAVLEVDTSGDITDCHNALQEICNCINSYIAEDDIKSYYIINPGNAEIHIKENVTVSLDKNESEEHKQNMTDEDLEKVTECLYSQELMNGIYMEADIFDRATNIFCKNPDSALFNLFVESCELLGVDKSIVTSISDRIISENPISESGFFFTTSSAVDNYAPLDNIPFDICTEAYSIMQCILEDTENNTNKDKDKNEKVEETDKKVSKLQQLKDKIKDKKEEKSEEKETKGKVDPITNIKLYFQGLKKNVRDLGAKGKQLTNNANAAFDRLARSVKDALVSDRREAVIKGSVIPSFSKSCKLAVGLAGIAKFASPAAALVTAIGGLVASKNLTRKERALLLDEIDVELEMIEKEIQLAEQKNQMKKLRKLMLIKKDLQREYQRIKLNVRIGKDIVPGVTTGGRKKYD